MIIGFTGSRRGLTSEQEATIGSLLFELEPERVHHGDCIGADARFHHIAREMSIAITVHPPEDSKHRAFCHGDEHKGVRSYLIRNRNTVNQCDLLIACPRFYQEEVRSGTWATIRYARAFGREYIIVWPSGIRNVNRAGVRRPAMSLAQQLLDSVKAQIALARGDAIHEAIAQGAHPVTEAVGLGDAAHLWRFPDGSLLIISDEGDWVVEWGQRWVH